MSEKISGYRELDPVEVELINQTKSVANALGEAIEGLENKPFVDKRWLAIAKTDLQKGMMALVRSIAQPEGF